MRSTRERLLHTALFEAFAILIATPTVAWITDAPLGRAGLLSLLVSLGAMLANYVWTLIFDRLVPTRRRGLWLRAAQAVGLELIIAAFTVPLVLLLTDARIVQAIMLDLGGIGFFVLFGMAYNAAFDAVMLRVIGREKGRLRSSSDSRSGTSTR